MYLVCSVSFKAQAAAGVGVGVGLSLPHGLKGENMKDQFPSTQSGGFPASPDLPLQSPGPCHSGESHPDQSQWGEGLGQPPESVSPNGNSADSPGSILSLCPSPFPLLMLQEAPRAVEMYTDDSTYEDHHAQSFLVPWTQLVFA